jgi:hypothetical protein
VLCSEESRCRKGSANLLVNLAELWPAGQVPTAAFLDHPLCGSGLPRNFWVSCRGERRGYRYIDDDILSLCSAMYIDYSFWACLSISELQRKKTDLEKLLWNYPSVSPDCSKRTGM